jgi:hypothetical protein
MKRRERRPVSEEFVRHIADNGYTAELLNEHVRSTAGEFCVKCGQAWPCRMRHVAELALALLQSRQQP